MAKTIGGIVLFAQYEKEDTFNYTNPTDGRTKLLRSLKVLLAHGDGTVTRESLSIPDNYRMSALEAGTVYGFPCIVSVSKKSGKPSYTLRSDLPPLPAAQIG